MKIQKAERKAVKIKLAITGPSGAGKTMSSLLLAKGLVSGGRILVIDSEDGSSNLYADHDLLGGIQFDVIEIEAPYAVSKYLKALEMGVQEKYDAIIIDSLSHAWAGEGGLLEKKQGLDSRGGNSYTNWATITKEQELFKSRIVHCPTHVIATMRSKQDYVIEANDKGKSAPKKVGLAPIQRDGLEYEFTIVFDVGMDHQFHVSKDRTGIFDGCIERITEKTGVLVKEWLEGGAQSKAEEKFKALLKMYSENDKIAASFLIQTLTDDDKKVIGSKLNQDQLLWVKEISKNPVASDQLTHAAV